MKHIDESTLKEWQICYFINHENEPTSQLYDPEGHDITYFPCWDTKEEAFKEINNMNSTNKNHVDSSDQIGRIESVIPKIQLPENSVDPLELITIKRMEWKNRDTDTFEPMVGLEIVETLRDYLIKHPEIRFTQALYNLDINQFANKENPGTEKHQLRDPYNDSNKVVLERVKKRLEK
jgi:hypothetical protein